MRRVSERDEYFLCTENISNNYNAVMGKHVPQPDIRIYNADYTLTPQQIVVEHKAGKSSDIYLNIMPKDRATLKINSCSVSRICDFPSVALFIIDRFGMQFLY